MKLKPVTFARTKLDFTSALNKRVGDYFKSKGITRHGNSEMFVKTICMFLLYLIPYGLIVTNLVTGTLFLILLVLVMSIGLGGIGLSVMHDANHGAYSKKSWLNSIVGYSLNFVGANSYNWKMQHNVLHHTYTNVHEEDEDISPRGILRMSPHSKWKVIHKFQHWYAWFFYGLMTLSWIFVKDFRRLISYQKSGLVKKQHGNIVKEWVILAMTKIIYITYIFIIPVLVTSLTWWQVLLGIVIMHYIAGFMLAIIFQPAHVIDGTEFPLPDDKNELENNWAVHQLKTTTNFGNKSRWFSWYVGGLNFQIEHHLFPNVCHVHYRRISSIVKDTAREFNLPYKSARTFFEAVRLHAKLLRQLGLKPLLVRQ